MVFKRSSIPLGEGKVVSARHKDNKMEFLISSGCAIIKKTLDSKNKINKGVVVSYADDAIFAKNGIIERKGSVLIYVPNDE